MFLFPATGAAHGNAKRYGGWERAEEMDILHDKLEAERMAKERDDHKAREQRWIEGDDDAMRLFEEEHRKRAEAVADEPKLLELYPLKHTGPGNGMSGDFSKIGKTPRPYPGTQPKRGDGPRHLVSVWWLALQLEVDNLRIVDASWVIPPPEGPLLSSIKYPRSEFAATRIPGSVFYDMDASDDTSGLPHMLPSAAFFEKKMAELGIGTKTRVIAYDSLGLFSAPRLWWMLRAFGHEDAAVLDGGLPAWLRAGLDTESGAPPTPRTEPLDPEGPHGGPFVAKLNPEVLCTHEQLEAHLEAKGGFTLVDGRSAGRFEGREPEPAAARGGHVPGAVSVPYQDLLDRDERSGQLRRVEELHATFDRAGVPPEGPLVVSCGSGITSAVLALALDTLGRDHVSLHDGAWAEWALRAPETKVETGKPRAVRAGGGDPRRWPSMAPPPFPPPVGEGKVISGEGMEVMEAIREDRARARASGTPSQWEWEADAPESDGQLDNEIPDLEDDDLSDPPDLEEMVQKYKKELGLTPAWLDEDFRRKLDEDLRRKLRLATTSAEMSAEVSARMLSAMSEQMSARESRQRRRRLQLLGPLGDEIEAKLEEAFPEALMISVVDKSMATLGDAFDLDNLDMLGDKDFSIFVMDNEFVTQTAEERQAMLREILKEELPRLGDVTFKARAPGELRDAESKDEVFDAVRGQEVRLDECIVAPACTNDTAYDKNYRELWYRPPDERRRLQAACQLNVCAARRGTAMWFDDWRASLDDWWFTLPFSVQHAMGNCLGALGLHLGSRFETALNAWRALLGSPPLPPKQPPTEAAEPGCEWLREQTSTFELPDFPAFPSEPDAFTAPVLPIPNLLPDWQQRTFLQSLEREQPPYAQQPTQQWVAMGSGAAAGAAFAAVAVALLHIRKPRRQSPGEGRRQHGARIAVRKGKS